jgi:phosphatidylglycerophosphate synthase
MSLRQWNIIHSICILTALSVYHLFGWYWPVLIIAFLSVVLLWISQWYTISNIKPAGGYANLLTLLRFSLLLLIVAFSNIWSSWSLGLLFTVPVILDGLDGYLARRLNQSSRFGALFDLETDSLFITFTGMILYQRNSVGAWILPVAYLRYFYVLLIWILQLNRIQEKRTRFGPFIAFIMFASLILEFLFNSAVTHVILLIASCLILLSFIWSFFEALSKREVV